MNLSINELLQWDTGAVERVLWLDGVQVVVIDMDDDQALPIVYEYATVAESLAAGTVQTQVEDSYLLPPENDAVLPEAVRQKRDQAWEVIHEMVGNPDIFRAKDRGRLVAEIMARTGHDHKTIYRYLRRYWQGGQTPNALLPRHDRCGGYGKPRLSAARKRGRPSQLALERQTSTGVNVNEEILSAFRKGIRRFYESGEEPTLCGAYQRTLEHYFNQGYTWQDGVPVPDLPPVDKLPTLRQFKYWYYKEQNLTRTLVSRKGQREFDSQHRALLGDSTGMAFGPGSVFQIDATVGDIYLVSALDPQRVIGRPIIYLVVDVFSRMVVGLSVTLEGPSWLGAMLALENAATQKVSLCARHDVAITPEEWPCAYLPEMLLADRGELEGNQSDNLVHALNVVVSNTAPYRADMKGIVEQCFRLSNDRVLATLPGSVREQRRGESDYRLEARLNVRQLTTLLIRGVLYHNQAHRLTDYPLDRQMLVDGVEPYPLDLWNWGIRNRIGHLRSLAPDFIRLSLLPQDKAIVTRRGIQFGGLQYTCPLATREGWYVKAGHSGRWSVRVSYDPRLVDWLYLWHEDGRQVEACSLVENTRMALFRGLDRVSVKAHFAQQRAQQQSSQGRQQQGRAALNAHKDHVTREAQTAYAETEPISQAAKVRGIRSNRQAERARHRQDEAWRLAGNQSPAVPGAEDGSTYIPPAQYLDLLGGKEGDNDRQ
jgi:hypothetical protein